RRARAGAPRARRAPRRAGARGLGGLGRTRSYTVRHLHRFRPGAAEDSMTNVPAGDPGEAALASTPVPTGAPEPRLSDTVADLLRRSIIERQLPAGARLPTERELGEQFGVSRTVVREAMRTLVAKGLLEVRSGSGVYVASVDERSVRDSMNTFLLGTGLP